VGTGRHEVRFDAEELPTGIYLYRLITQTGTQTRKLTLVK